MLRGSGPGPVVAFREPIREPAGQVAEAASGSGQSGTPLIFASSPFGRCREKPRRAWSPSGRVRSKTKGLNFPAVGSVTPAFWVGLKPWLQPSVIFIVLCPEIGGSFE